MAKNIFNSILVKRPKHSYFDLSHDHKLSFKMGKLVPVTMMEALPGDHFRMSSEAMFRMMPMIAPIMHKVDVYMHFFFVPNRILWPNWEKFIMGPESYDPLSPQAPPAFPILSQDQSYNFEASSLGNYLGLPISSVTAGSEAISAMPFAAYQRIWYEYYRDQNLETTVPFIELADGEQDATTSNHLTSLRDRAWEHDYFTSALPWAQKGAAVSMPLSLNGDIEIHSQTEGGNPTSATPKWRDRATGNISANGNTGQGFGSVSTAGVASTYDPDGDLYLDADDFHTTTTINDLRTAFSLQKWLEKNARAGSRYVEGLLAHFGVKSSDARLQRPEYLGGSKANMAISEVLQMSQTNEDATPQGNMAGHGIAVSGGKEFSYFCEEHGIIMGLLSVRPKTAYYQGVPKIFSKTVDKLQYYWPDFAFLGEQEILNKEVYFADSDADNNDVFGYIPRYSEYRFVNSRVSGQMADTFDFWHMGRKFSSRPHLNADFIRSNPTDRIFAVQGEDNDEVVAHIFHKILAKRPLPKYGSPGSI